MDVLNSVMVPISLALIATIPAVLTARKQLADAEQRRQEADDKRALEMQKAIAQERDRLWEQALAFQNKISAELERVVKERDECRDDLRKCNEAN
jgi:mannitol-1-phosphate/altronate dehydrogenase